MLDNLFRDGELRTFVVPPQTVAGDGSSSRVGQVLAASGVGRGVVAVVADDAVVRLGLIKKAIASLETTGFEVALTNTIASEPTLEDARRCVEVVRSRKAIAVVGIGGGSALDLAKLAAVAASRDEEIENYLGTRDDLDRRLRLVAVPTTAGTGSEATRISMLSVSKQKRIVSSAALIPDVVILDPELVLSLPGPVTAATGLDALCHAIEALLSTNRSRLSVADSQHGLRLVAGHLRKSYFNPDDVEARRNVLYGAHFAGRGLNAGVVLGHSVGYAIANRAAVAHGISCAMALPYCIRYSRDNAALVADIATQIIGTTDVDALIDWVHELNRSLGVPASLTSIGIPPAAAAEMARECIERYPRPNNPSPLEPGRLNALFEAMATGDTSTARIA